MMLIRGDMVLRGFDDDIRAMLTQEMRKKGIDIRSETFVRDIEKQADGTLSLLTKMGDTLEVDTVLYATGRVPHTQGLGLEEVGGGWTRGVRWRWTSGRARAWSASTRWGT